jgi:ATP-dependent helicase/nuclease subunit B
MPIRLHFLDWSAPALPAVVDYLVQEYSVLGHCDLSNVIAVFPGSRAGRRFLELLAEKTEGRNQPPDVVTVGGLPERLYEPKRPFANPLTETLAWVEALRGIPRERLGALLSQPPDDADIETWMSLGEMLSRQHVELTADRLDFGLVTQRGSELPTFNEAERWGVLHEVQKAYLQTLDSLELWDRETARLVAIDHKECRTDRQIILVGAVDLNQTLRAMLDQVADKVTALVHAPPSLRPLFDGHGCLIPDLWEQRPIDLMNSQIQVVDRPSDQADAMLKELTRVSGERRVDEITVGMGDERIVQQIQRRLDEERLKSAWVSAKVMSETGPYRLLSAIADYLESGHRTDAFSALIRHPDMTSWLDQQGLSPGWLSSVDHYLSSHFQRRLGAWLGKKEESQTTREVFDRLQGLLGNLASGAQPLPDWTDPIVTLLTDVYQHRELSRDRDEDRFLLESATAIQQTLVAHTDVPDRLVLSVTCSQAIRLTLDELAMSVFPQHGDEDSLTLLGWLELALDDAPVLILTGCNEGHIPSSLNSDLFLPNTLRKHLGVTDNARRYARDAYALSVLVHSREQLTVIAGRRDPNDEPLAPSRLLFACPPDEIARRVERFYGEPAPPAPPRGPFRETREKSAFPIPRPVRQPRSLDKLSVTAFRDYIHSPYRFYLRHVLRLKEVQQEASELDAPAFGNLIHDVLGAFGRSDVRIATDDRDIRQYLQDELDRVVLQLFGDDVLVPIRVQIEQARARLHAFATWQAEWTRLGWDIKFAEEPANAPPAPFDLGDGRFLGLTGRIDRIDQNRRTGDWMIFDYKTGDSAKTPDKAHHDGENWKDLQLPLYRHLAKPLGVEGTVGLGYITLSRDAADIREQIADWSEEFLETADAEAQRIGREILNQEFWVPLSADPDWLPEFAPICQDGVFDREAIV